MKVSFTLNGKQESINAPADARLADVLHDTFAIHSVKNGCGSGRCGSCSVLLGTRLVAACVVPIFAVRGKEITSFEGFCRTDDYVIIEQALEKAGSVNCGVCLPAKVLSIHALLTSRRELSDDDILRGLSSVSCRCTDATSLIAATHFALDAHRGKEYLSDF